MDADPRLIVGGLVHREDQRSRFRRGRVVVAVVPEAGGQANRGWTLPHGEATVGDVTLADAALRVAAEQTGFMVERSGLADVIGPTQEDPGEAWIIWMMEGTASGSATRPQSHGVRWVDADEAAALVSRPGQGDFIRRAADLLRRQRTQSTRRAAWNRLGRGNPQAQRLRDEIDDIAADLRPIVAKHGSADVRPVSDHLGRARLSVATGELDTGWAQAFRAREALVAWMSSDEVESTALALRAEVVVGEKIKRWRQEAITSLLQPIVGSDAAGTRKAALPAHREALRQALQLRNESFSNEYRHLTILRRHQRTLLMLGATALVAILLILFPFGAFTSDPSSGLVLLASLTMGVLGAVISAAQRSTRFQGARIPQALNSNVASYSRVAIGGIAGILVWLGAQVVNQVDGLTVASMMVGAFGAGFAERLVAARPDG